MLLTHIAGSPTLVLPPRNSGAVSATVDPEVRNRVWNLVGKLYPSGNVGERRGERRYPFPQLVHLSPVPDERLEASHEPVVVVGKHISERGIGFFHREPLAYRRVIASVPCGDDWLGLLTHLTWCRFTRHGWYESGGRFLKVAPSQVHS